MLRHHDEHQAIQQDRAAQQTREWRDRYQQRNGIEATVSQGVRAYGPRRSRYRGQPKTHLQHLFAAAMNLSRLDHWTNGTPRIGARISRFGTEARRLSATGLKERPGIDQQSLMPGPSSRGGDRV